MAMGRSLAGNEEITPQELAIKIKTNADTNKQYMTVLLGHQQGLEILTRNAQTIEDIESIHW